MARLPAPVYRAIGWFSTTRVDRVLHPLLYRRTAGAGLLGRVLGCETILLTAPGLHTGTARTVALFAFPLDRGWFVIASRGGSGRIPAWYRNVAAARDRVTVQVRDQVVPVVARDAEGDEYEACFERAVRAYDGYRLYRAAAAHRIPVVALERREPAA